MKQSNANKHKALGMHYGTATSRLRKVLLFNFAEKLGLRNCFRCGIYIESIDEFSIEHKTSWLYSDDPFKTFFDVDNIAFSHLVCNVRAASPPPYKSPRSDNKRNRSDRSFCSKCQTWKSSVQFGFNRSKTNGLATECKDCRRLRNKRRI